MIRAFAMMIVGALFLGACAMAPDGAVQTTSGKAGSTKWAENFTQALAVAIGICIDMRSAETVSRAAIEAGWKHDANRLVNGQVVFEKTPGQVCDLRFPRSAYDASVCIANAYLESKGAGGPRTSHENIDTEQHLINLQEDPPNVLTFWKNGPPGQAQLLR